MRIVRIVGAVKRIEESEHNVTLFRIQEILSEHRCALITRILADLPTYLRFKFYAKVNNEMQLILRDKLFELANSKVNLDRYGDIIQEIKQNSTYHVPSREFFNEIDSVLDAHLNPSQLQLMR